MPHGNKVISSRDVRIDEMSHFSWKDVRDPEIVPAFEDRFVSIEHGNPVHLLIEDVMEEPTITHTKIDKQANNKNNSVSESKNTNHAYYNEGNLPTPRSTPENLNEDTNTAGKLIPN